MNVNWRLSLLWQFVIWRVKMWKTCLSDIFIANIWYNILLIYPLKLKVLPHLERWDSKHIQFALEKAVICVSCLTTKTCVLFTSLVFHVDTCLVSTWLSLQFVVSSIECRLFVSLLVLFGAFIKSILMKIMTLCMLLIINFFTSTWFRSVNSYLR